MHSKKLKNERIWQKHVRQVRNKIFSQGGREMADYTGFAFGEEGLREACGKLPNLCKFLNGLELREVPDYARIRVFLFGDEALHPLGVVNSAVSVCIVDALG